MTMIEPAVTTSEPTSWANFTTSRAKPPSDESTASAFTGSAAKPSDEKARHANMPKSTAEAAREDRASGHDFPKFVTVGAAMEHELRKVGTRPCAMACAAARSRDQNPSAAIRAIPVYVFQFIRFARSARPLT